MTLANIITRDYAERYAKHIGSKGKAIKAIKAAQFVSSFVFTTEENKIYLSIGDSNSIRIK